MNGVWVAPCGLTLKQREARTSPHIFDAARGTPEAPGGVPGRTSVCNTHLTYPLSGPTDMDTHVNGVGAHFNDMGAHVDGMGTHAINAGFHL